MGATRQPVRTLDGIAGKVNALRFSADGSMLFAAAGEAGVNGVAYQWKTADGSLVRKYEGHKDALYALALSPDGQTLATGSYDQKIKLWKVADGTEMKTLSGHNGGIYGLSFRPDGKVLASAQRGPHDQALGRGRRQAARHAFRNRSRSSRPWLSRRMARPSWPAAWTAAFASGRSARKPRKGSNPLLLTRFAHEGAILNLAFSADGQQLVTSAADRTVKVWKASDASELHALDLQPDWSPGLALLDGGLVALGRLDGSLGFYDAATGKATEAPKPMAKAPMAKAAKASRETGHARRPGNHAPGARGVQSGATTTIKLSGKNLAGIKDVKFSAGGLKATVGQDDKGMGAELTITADAKVPRSQVEMSVVTATGESAKQKLLVDYLPQIVAPCVERAADARQAAAQYLGHARRHGAAGQFPLQGKEGRDDHFRPRGETPGIEDGDAAHGDSRCGAQAGRGEQRAR